MHQREEWQALHAEGRQLRWEEEFGSIESAELINLRGLFPRSKSRKLILTVVDQQRTLAELLPDLGIGEESRDYSLLRLSQTIPTFYAIVDEAIAQEGLADARSVSTQQLRDLYYRLRSMGYSHADITQ